MKVGDLVESIYGLERHKAGSFGIIVDIDPLRRGRHGPFRAANEIVVLLDNGVLWYASPSAWKVKNESR